MTPRYSRCAARAHRRVVPKGLHGFTLVELIMVIVILGVLAVYAAPRIFDSNDFKARGFHDETLSLLRYAQKAAIAQRRIVCVTFDTTVTQHTARLTMENPTLSTTPLACNTNLTGPKGDRPGTITAPAGVTYSAAPNIIFDGLGQPVNTSRVALSSATTIQVANSSKTITVEAATGYVRD